MSEDRARRLKDHFLYCDICCVTVVVKAPTRRDAIRALDDPAVHVHRPSMVVRRVLIS